MNNQEKSKFNNREVINDNSLESLRSEQQNKLREDIERKAEIQSHDTEEEAHHEALEYAASVEKERKKEIKINNPLEHRRTIPTKKEREVSFKRTLRETQAQMSEPSRLFSKFIHNKNIERVSDTVGGTIARPNAILSGATLAFLFTLVIYLIARYDGYPLSGTETIASFLFGWVLGLIFDYVRLLLQGRR